MAKILPSTQKSTRRDRLSRLVNRKSPIVNPRVNLCEKSAVSINKHGHFVPPRKTATFDVSEKSFFVIAKGGQKPDPERRPPARRAQHESARRSPVRHSVLATADKSQIEQRRRRDISVESMQQTFPSSVRSGIFRNASSAAAHVNDASSTLELRNLAPHFGVRPIEA